MESQIKMLLTIFLTAQLLTACQAIRCYQCGSEAIFLDYIDTQYPLPKSDVEQIENTAVALESCSNLESSYSSWGMFSVECGPGQICTKTIIEDGVDEYGRHHYVTASRACAMRNNSLGKVHQLGCGVMKTNMVPPVETTVNRWDLVCFCGTDYCNGANKHATKTYTMVAISSIFFLFRTLV